MDFRELESAHMGNHPTLKSIQILEPVQRCDLLQKGYYGHSEIHDGLEVGLGHVQGFIKEDGMEYGGCEHDES